MDINNQRQRFEALPYKGKYKKTGFAAIPNVVMFDPNLSNCGKLVCWVLTTHNFRGRDRCFPSLETIRKETKLSRNSVIKGIRELEGLGYLEIDRKKGIRNEYYLKVKI